MDDDLSKDDAENVADAMDRMDGDTAESGVAPAEGAAAEAATSDAGAATATAEAPAEGNGDTPPVPQPAEEPGGISKAQFVQLEELAAAADIPPANLEKMQDLKVNVQAVLGRTRMPLEEVLKLHQGSLVELDKLAGEPVEITANGKTIARAEVVVIDGSFGVKIIDIVGMRQKLSAAGG